MKNIKTHLGIFIIALIFVITAVSCEFGLTLKEKFDPEGIWDFNINGRSAVVYITGNNYSFSGAGDSDTGTFKLDGNTATLYSTVLDGAIIGTGTFTSKTTITLNLISPSNITGVFNGHKRILETNNNKIKMVQIPVGTLKSSSTTITLSAYKIGKYEVTQEQYEAVIGYNPSGFISNPAAGETQGKRPVENVTWYDAIEFCNKLSIKEGLTPVYTITGRTPATGYPITAATVTANWSNNGYRLPTEAQWEYAYRAGTTTEWWYFGNDESKLINYAWYNANSNDITHEVGKKLPNAWGLYDMHGNVSEWCWDWYGDLPNTNQTDYKGVSSGTYNVVRGGNWEYPSALLTIRSRILPYGRGIRIGFRVVLP